MEKKHPEEHIKIDRTKSERRFQAELRVVSFKDGEFYMNYIPSLNLTGYGDTDEEARHMLMDIVLKDYIDNLMHLPESDLYAELRQYGWVRKPFLTKQLRNIQFLDTNTIKDTFNLPAETVIEEKYVTA